MSRKWMLHLIFLCSWSCLFASSESCAKPSRKPSRDIAAFDAFHTWCSKGIVRLANKVDYFFGKTRIDEESNGTYGRISFESRVIESDSVKFTTRQRIRLNLPGTEKRLKLVFDKSGIEQEENEARNDTALSSTSNQGFDAAIRYIVKRKAKFSTQFDGGGRVRRHRPFNLFARLRNRFSWDISERFLIRFVNQAFYFVRTYGVVESRLDFDFVMKGSSIIRWGHFLNWEDRNDFFKFSQSLSYLKTFDDQKALGIHFVAGGDNEIKTSYTDYYFFVQYRQKVYKDWLFAELRPQIHFPKVNEFKSVLSFSIKFEFLFGNY